MLFQVLNSFCPPLTTHEWGHVRIELMPRRSWRNAKVTSSAAQPASHLEAFHHGHHSLPQWSFFITQILPTAASYRYPLNLNSNPKTAFLQTLQRRLAPAANSSHSCIICDPDTVPFPLHPATTNDQTAFSIGQQLSLPNYEYNTNTSSSSSTTTNNNNNPSLCYHDDSKNNGRLGRRLHGLPQQGQRGPVQGHYRC